MINMKHPKTERTFVMIKTDGIQRSLAGEIIQRYENIGLKLIGVKMVTPTEKQIEEHYTLNPEWRKITGEKTIAGYKKKGLIPPSEDPYEITDKILKNLQKYMTSGPAIAMIWQGAHAVAIGRKLAGGTEPLTSDVGTIRGDYVLDSYQMSDQDDRAVRNLLHASGTVEEAEMEINHWFSKDEISSYRLIQEQMLYDVNLDGIKE